MLWWCIKMLGRECPLHGPLLLPNYPREARRKATLGVLVRPGAHPGAQRPGYLCPKPENCHLARRNSETASGGSGLSKWKPWAMSQPISSKRAPCPRSPPPRL